MDDHEESVGVAQEYPPITESKFNDAVKHAVKLAQDQVMILKLTWEEAAGQKIPMGPYS